MPPADPDNIMTAEAPGAPSVPPEQRSKRTGPAVLWPTNSCLKQPRRSLRPSHRAAHWRSRPESSGLA